SWSGTKLLISVTVSGLSGLRNAYTSALSATGSLLISGASRCEDIVVTSLCARRRCLEQSPRQRTVAVGRLARARDHGHLAARGVAHVSEHRLGRVRRGGIGGEASVLPGQGRGARHPDRGHPRHRAGRGLDEG